MTLHYFIEYSIDDVSSHIPLSVKYSRENTRIIDEIIRNQIRLERHIGEAAEIVIESKSVVFSEQGFLNALHIFDGSLERASRLLFKCDRIIVTESVFISSQHGWKHDDTSTLRLPSNLVVRGMLVLTHVNIRNLPINLSVKDLVLHNTNVTELPDSLQVEGLIDCNPRLEMDNIPPNLLDKVVGRD